MSLLSATTEHGSDPQQLAPKVVTSQPMSDTFEDCRSAVSNLTAFTADEVPGGPESSTISRVVVQAWEKVTHPSSSRSMRTLKQDMAMSIRSPLGDMSGSRHCMAQITKKKNDVRPWLGFEENVNAFD